MNSKKKSDYNKAGAIARFKPYENAIIFNRWPESVDHSFTHEACHAIAGREQVDGFKTSRLKGIFDGNGRGGVVIDEAVTEHIAQSLVHGSVDVTDPSKKDGSYEKYRSLLDVLCTKGIKKIDIRQFINAYFEEDDSVKPGSVTACETLISSLNAAFPGDIISDISNLGIDDVEDFTKSLIKSTERS